MRDLRRLLKYLRPYWPIFTLATFAMVLVGLLQSATGALIVPIFDQAFAPGTGQRTSTLFGLQNLIPQAPFGAWKMISILLVVFTLIKGIAEYLSTYLMARIGQSAVLKLRQDLYRHLLAQSATFFEKHRTNYLVSRLVSSAAAIETAIVSTVRDMLRESFTLIAFLAASFYYSWRLTLASLVIAPIIALLTAKFGKALRNLPRRGWRTGRARLHVVGFQESRTTTANRDRAHRSELRRPRGGLRSPPRESFCLSRTDR
jgi:subfamily B ATP-binding cassette protein MsbA